MRRLPWTLAGVGLVMTLSVAVVLALNYEGEDLCEHAKAWPGGTYLGQMHPYHSDFYRGLRELGYTATAPGAASAPAPASKSDPTPAPSSDPGDWRYFESAESPFMALDAYDDTNESFYDDVSMRLSCHRNRPFFVLDGGGPWIALGETRTASASESRTPCGFGPMSAATTWRACGLIDATPSAAST